MTTIWNELYESIHLILLIVQHIPYRVFQTWSDNISSNKCLVWTSKSYLIFIFHQNKSLFYQFPCLDGKKYWSGVRSILMPPTFHIAHLDHHTRKISGVPLKVTWCQGLGVQSLCHPVCTNNIQMFLKIPETSGFEHQAVLFVMNLQTNRGIKTERICNTIPVTVILWMNVTTVGVTI